MKKEKASLKTRLLAAFCAFAICGGGFLASCSSGDDDDGSNQTNNNTPETPETPSTPENGKGTTTDKITVKNGSESVYSGDDINAAWAAIGSSGDYVITLAKGSYSVTEGTQLSYSGAANIKISGDTTTEYGSDVIITGNPKTASQKKRELVYMAAGSTGSLTLENVRFVNEYGTTTGDAQAEVLATDGSGNLAAYNCSFISGQDTLRTVAKAWFYKCYIEGDVDFLWMETTGTVALYEECVLKAIDTRTTKAYFTAPRAALTSKVGKGLVVYNSELKAGSGLEKLYLARNPWASSSLSSYYNNVAFVGTTYTGDATITDLWASASNGTTDKQYIGFKADSNFTASTTTHGAVLSDGVKTAEYAGRRNILNRVYNTSSAKYQKDSETSWDIDSVISANNWTVTEDTSKDLLDGETEVQSTTYDFANKLEAYSDITTEGTVNDNDVDSNTGVRKSHLVIGSGATIKFPVTGKCVVTVTGYYKGTGTIKAGDQGAALLDFNNNSTSKLIEKAYTVYSGACDVTISASAQMYITKIVVEYDSALTFTPVTAIAVKAAENATEVASKKTLQFSATLTPTDVTNDDIVWSISSGSDVATIDQTGLLTAGSADADTSVTVRVTSCDANAVYGEATVTVKKLEANACDITWFDGTESFSAAGTSSDDTVLTAGDATYEWLGGFAGATTTTAYGTANATSGHYYQATSSAATGGDSAVAFFKLTVPVTAVADVKITNITGTFDESVTGNITRTISVNGSDEISIGDGKTVSLNKDFDVSVSAGSTVNVVITTYVKASKSIAANKTAKQCVKSLCVSCEKQ